MDYDDLFQPLSFEKMVSALTKNNEKERNIYHRGDLISYGLNINPPAELSNIERLEAHCKVKFPEQYIAFLQLADGITFSNHESEIVSLERKFLI